jgi:hypothetical protein
MFASSSPGQSKPAGYAPTQYRSDNTFATSFSGPIKQNERLFDTARNQSMAQAAFQGDTRQFEGQQGRGVQAGGAMAAYRAGIQGDTEAAKAYAQAQQDMFNKYADRTSADLQFQERLAGERGWVQDLLLDRDQTRNRERMAAFKRDADVKLGDIERRTKEAMAAERRKTTILGGLI